MMIVAFWAWLGASIEMPPSPLAPGEKLQCVSYAPFRGSQSPLDATTRIPPEQIEQDLRQLAEVTDCVRTYATEMGLDRVPEIAKRHGLKVLQGVWVSSRPDFVRREVETAVALARRYPDVITGIIVGNEVLLRGEMPAPDLIQIIRDVKAQAKVPVTYADVWEFWLRNRPIAEVVDFITIHILPYWEDFPIPADRAAAHLDEIRKLVVAAFPNREILIGETGWPSAGRMREGALPSPASQARVLHDVVALAKREGVRVNLIEAYDQPWKRRLEGTVGGYWGLFTDEPRTRKFVWGEAISNHPNWRLQAAGGVIFAALIFAVGYFGGRVSGAVITSLVPWAGVAVIATAGGGLIGWAVENARVESLGADGWTRSLALVAVATLAPAACGVATLRGTGIPAYAQILGRTEDRISGWFPMVLGWTWIVLGVLALQTALGLVFDPRYRDFPSPALTIAAVAFFIASLAGARRQDPNPTAERVAAGILALSAVYIVLNESFANWQAVWLCAVLLVLTVILWRARGAPS
jgi:glucan 1,3-beta-glucosidase